MTSLSQDRRARRVGAAVNSKPGRTGERLRQRRRQTLAADCEPCLAGWPDGLQFSQILFTPTVPSIGRQFRQKSRIWASKAERGADQAAVGLRSIKTSSRARTRQGTASSSAARTARICTLVQIFTGQPALAPMAIGVRQLPVLAISAKVALGSITH